MSSRSPTGSPIRPRPTIPTSRRPCRPHSTTWGSWPGCRSRRPRSTGSSSVPAPTAGCRTCAMPPSSPRAARWRAMCGPGSCRAPKTSSARLRPRASTASSSTPASNGASRVARCAWRSTATPSHRARGVCRPPTATSSVARGRADARISPAPPWPRPPPSPAASPTSGRSETGGTTMEAFTVLDAKAAPLMRQNVNTDIIIPIHRLRDVAQAELGPYAFEPWRYLPDGSENPEFFMHQPAYRGAEIVVADNNFACGSSREGAVWAMMGMGVRCVIAPSFGPIFFNNCFQNGVLPIQLPRADVLAIADELEAATRPGSNSEPRLSIDLHNRTVVTPSGRKIEFHVDGIRRDALLKGLNEVALTLTRENEIAAHQAKARAATPWLYPSSTN